MLTAQLVEKQVKFVDDRTAAFKMSGEIRVSDFAIACLDGGPVGLITAAFDGSVSFWPESFLRSVGEDAGVTLPPMNIPKEQWPFRRLDARSVQAAMLAPPPESNENSSARHPPGGSGSTFQQDAARWLINYSDLKMKRDIGAGAFGAVKLASWNEIEVAVKLLKSLEHLGVSDLKQLYGDSMSTGFEGAAAEEFKTLEREVALMMEMRHPNIILFLGVCATPPAIVTEYCARGSLYDLLKEAHDDPDIARQLDWTRRLSIAMDAAKGMLYLHSHKPPIIHRDLKSPNLLIDRHWRAKVTDFNLSRLSEAPSVASSVVANNPRWHAPEIIISQNFSLAGDVYAFGLILWELLTWELPFSNLSNFQIIVAVGQNGQRPDVPRAGSSAIRGKEFVGYDEYVALMESCWAQDAAERPRFETIIASLRTIATKMGAAAADQAKASAAAAAALQAVAAEDDDDHNADFTVAGKDGESEDQRGGDDDVEASAYMPPPHVLSPFDLPSNTNTNGYQNGGSVVPPPSPFDFAPGPPPVLSPFDVPAAAAAVPGHQFPPPPPPMRSPFDDSGAGAPPSDIVGDRSDSASEAVNSSASFRSDPVTHGIQGQQGGPGSGGSVMIDSAMGTGGDGSSNSMNPNMSSKMKSSGSSAGATDLPPRRWRLCGPVRRGRP